jgi:SPP1 family predicted phage head-tail adaptor
MNIGQLRHRIEFQRLERYYDNEGFPIEDYVTFQRAWADVNDLYGKEYWSSKQTISENIIVFNTRYYKDIDANCFIFFKGKRYEIIEPPDNIKYLNKELKIKAKLQVINNGD